MIVHGVLSLDVGGLERIVVSLAKHTGNAAVVCIERPGALAAELAGHRVISLDKPPGRHVHFVDVALSVLLELKPTVLHTHQIGAAYYLAPAAKRMNLRVVHTEHGNAIARASSRLEALKLRMLFRHVMKSVDAVAAVSPEIAATLTRWGTVPKAKVSVVPNGIAIAAPTRTRDEMRASLGIPLNAFVVGTVGRLHEVKRQHLILEAAAKANWHVLLVGDGPERSVLETLAKTLDIADRVTFAGYQSQTADYYAAMDAFVLSSRSEGFPVSLLEAWAAGVPVVAAAVGGIPSIVTGGIDGLLVSNHGEPESYADAVTWLDFEKMLIEKLIANGRETLLKHYTLAAMAERYRKLYSPTKNA